MTNTFLKCILHFPVLIYDFVIILFFYTNSLPFAKNQDLQKTESKEIPSKVVPITQTVIDGDRANYDEYDYNDYDMYAYDEIEEEKLKEEFKLKEELKDILSRLNMTTKATTEPPLPNAVSYCIFEDLILHFHGKMKNCAILHDFYVELQLPPGGKLLMKK